MWRGCHIREGGGVGVRVMPYRGSISTGSWGRGCWIGSFCHIIVYHTRHMNVLKKVF